MRYEDIVSLPCPSSFLTDPSFSSISDGHILPSHGSGHASMSQGLCVSAGNGTPKWRTWLLAGLTNVMAFIKGNYGLYTLGLASSIHSLILTSRLVAQTGTTSAFSSYHLFEKFPITCFPYSYQMCGLRMQYLDIFIPADLHDCPDQVVYTCRSKYETHMIDMSHFNSTLIPIPRQSISLSTNTRPGVIITTNFQRNTRKMGINDDSITT